MKKDLPDIQKSQESRNIPLKWVGVKDIIMPFALLKKNGGRVPIEAKIKIGVSLDSKTKGTHMSRLTEILNKYHGNYALNPISKEGYFGGVHIHKMLEELVDKLESENAYCKMNFKYFVEKKSPVSEQKGIMDYDCSFEGYIVDGQYEFFITVKAPIMTVCPCSKEISESGAHNQRGYAKIKVKSPESDFVWIEDLIDLVASQGSCDIYPLLKRNDEKWVTEHSYDNPKFVEDVVRDIAVALKRINIEEYEIEVETIESIHNHQAFAFTDWTMVNNL